MMESPEREQSPRFILHGTEGSFVKYGFDLREESLKGGFTPSESNRGIEPGKRRGTLIAPVGGSELERRVKTIAGCYQSIYENIVDVISGDAEFAVQLEEALRRIRLN